MIVGSGLLARAFAARLDIAEDACIYAAGVSNSACVDPEEFARDRRRVEQTLDAQGDAKLFVYFSTCSICDPWSQDNAYARHKRAIEDLIRERAPHLIVRLPQVAGHTPNPHTLLNYLYNRIVRSERFDLWQRATRNIIDIADATTIVADLMRNEQMRANTVNVANARNTPLPHIVAALEAVTQRRAIFNAVDRGGDYPIDVGVIEPSLARCEIRFDERYLERALQKYYGRRG